MCRLKSEFVQPGYDVTSISFKQVNTKQVRQVRCNDQKVPPLNAAFALMFNGNVYGIRADKKCALFSPVM